MMSKLNMPAIPVSWGELIDKLTILEIKSERIIKPEALVHILHEKTLLEQESTITLLNHQLSSYKAQLRLVNAVLWDIEDRIREKEFLQQFDDEFILLARSVYKQNDKRAAIKREINTLLESELFEEKSYKEY